MEKVSIIIPLYNAERYLKVVLNSLLKQTYSNLEYILINDGSTDNTYKILQEYYQQDAKIKLITFKENKGVSYARNAGLRLATGKYLFFFDSDDFLDDNAIKEMVQVALKENADLVELKMLYWFKHKKNILYFVAPELQERFYLNRMQIKGSAVYTSSYVTGKLYKRELIGELIFDETIPCYEDVIFTNEIIKRVKNYVFLKHLNYHYLQRSDSLINNFGLEHLNYLSIIKEIKGSSIVFDKRDELIINSILALISGKISKVNMPLGEKRELIRGAIATIGEMYPLSKKQMRLYQRFLIRLFRNKKFLFVYLIIIKKINLLKVTFFLKAKWQRTRRLKHSKYKEIKLFYELNSN